MHDMRVKLSTLWIFALFNYLYADVLTLFDLVLVEKPAGADTTPFEITQGFLFGAGVLMEIAIVMVVLSRTLSYRANRWANIIAGLIQTAAVLASMFVGTPTAYYIFFGTIEIACTSLIVWLAWKWPDPSAAESGFRPARFPRPPRRPERCLTAGDSHYDCLLRSKPCASSSTSSSSCRSKTSIAISGRQRTGRGCTASPGRRKSAATAGTR